MLSFSRTFRVTEGLGWPGVLKDAFGALDALKASFSAPNALKASFSTISLQAPTPHAPQRTNPANPAAQRHTVANGPFATARRPRYTFSRFGCPIRWARAVPGPSCPQRNHLSTDSPSPRFRTPNGDTLVMGGDPEGPRSGRVVERRGSGERRAVSCPERSVRDVQRR
ncbi:hypothetical protein GCM10023192_78670 [Amycolatopsis samaneae]